MSQKAHCKLSRYWDGGGSRLREEGLHNIKPQLLTEGLLYGRLFFVMWLGHVMLIYYENWMPNWDVFSLQDKQMMLYIIRSEILMWVWIWCVFAYIMWCDCHIRQFLIKGPVLIWLGWFNLYKQDIDVQMQIASMLLFVCTCLQQQIKLI